MKEKGGQLKMSKHKKYKAGDAKDNLELDTLNQNDEIKTEKMVDCRVTSSRHKVLHTVCLCSSMFIWVSYHLDYLP